MKFTETGSSTAHDDPSTRACNYSDYDWNWHSCFTIKLTLSLLPLGCRRFSFVGFANRSFLAQEATSPTRQDCRYSVVICHECLDKALQQLNLVMYIDLLFDCVLFVFLVVDVVVRCEPRGPCHCTCWLRMNKHVCPR